LWDVLEKAFPESTFGRILVPGVPADMAIISHRLRLEQIESGFQTFQ
jgi:hypothetical protein